MQKKWLDQDNSSDLEIYVVWSPQLGAQEKHVAEATELIPDLRAHHYWDPDMVIGTLFQKLDHPGGDELHLSGPAWDVWFLFAPDAVWESGSGPVPDWWEHQLRGMPDDNWLDPERFAAKAAELCGKN